MSFGTNHTITLGWDMYPPSIFLLFFYAFTTRIPSFPTQILPPETITSNSNTNTHIPIFTLESYTWNQSDSISSFMNQISNTTFLFSIHHSILPTPCFIHPSIRQPLFILAFSIFIHHQFHQIYSSLPALLHDESYIFRSEYSILPFQNRLLMNLFLWFLVHSIIYFHTFTYAMKTYFTWSIPEIHLILSSLWKYSHTNTFINSNTSFLFILHYYSSIHPYLPHSFLTN